MTSLNDVLHGSRRFLRPARGDRRTALVYLGTAAVVAAGAGAAGAATSGQANLPAAYRAAPAAAVISSGPSHLSSTSDLAASLPSPAQASVSLPVSLPAVQSGTSTPASGSTRAAADTPASTSAGGSAHPAAGTPAAQPTAPQPAQPTQPAVPATPVAAQRPAAPAAPAPAAETLNSWQAIEGAAAGHGGALPAMDIPLPAPVTASQSEMPISGNQWNNATTIVQQALDKGMGLRSAVIAVATAMQESQLVNIDYGTYDSLGLFQQRPSAGWGTPAQVTDPVYASDAFLDALHAYQVSNPGWATQPVWQPAQAVQDSAYPYAYEQWEVQAASVVMGVARNLVNGQ